MGPNVPQDQGEGPGTLHARCARVVAGCFGPATALGPVTPLAGDASSRRYFRLALSGGRAVPQTVVAMVLGADRLPLSSEELGVFETPPTELPYVNVGRFLSRIGIRIPKLYGYSPQDGILIQEDVGDQTLRAAAQGADGPRVLGLYRAAIDQLVRMQVGGTAHADRTCVAFQQRFDRRLFAWEFDHFLDYGLPSGGPAERARLAEAFAPVAERLAAAPVVLAHRDFHGWNLHVHAEEICVIDFQDALLAPATYDLASLLTDRDTGLVVTPAHEDHLIAYYMTARHQLGEPEEGAAAVREQYFLCVLQRALKVIGRFHYLERVKNKAGYLGYLPHVVAQARRALEAAPGVQQLRSLLFPYLVTSCAP